MSLEIIQVISYFPPHLGGMENVSRELSERLAKKGHRVEIFTSNIGCEKGKLKSKKNLKINYLPALEFVNTPIVPSLLWKLMRIPKDSVIHVHVAQAFVPEIVWIASRLRGIPYVAQIHSDSKPSSLTGKIFLNAYQNFFLKKFLIGSSSIIVLTKDYANIILKKYDVNNKIIKIIPNGVKEGFSCKKRKIKKIVSLLFVGRLVPSKNIPLLLESFKKVHIKNRNTKLHIVGEGKEKEIIKKFIKENNFKNNVFLDGIKTGRNLEKIYRNSDIFISTTRQESFGITYLEAMASGLPIVTTNLQSVKKVVLNGRNGYLVNPDSEEFSNATLKLIRDNKKRNEIIKNNLQDVKKYSWDKIAEQTEQVYREVLEEHNKKLTNKK